MATSRAAISRQRTGRNTAFRRKVDSAAYASAKARARAAPINVAGAQAVARRALRSYTLGSLESKIFAFSNGYNATIDDSNTACISLCDVIKGQDDGTRIGDEIKLQSFTFRASWYAGTSDTHMRVILFQMKQYDSGTVPTRATILFQSTQPGAGTVVNWSFNKDAIKAGQIRILADWRMPIKAASSATNGSGTLFYRTKKMSKVIQYLNGTNYGTNKLYLWFGSTIPTASATTVKPTINLQTDIWYSDA